jgi:ketosteroid isomerase-like protein
MNKQMKTMSQTVVLTVALAAYAPIGGPIHAQGDPMQVAKNYVETANSGNFEKTLAFFADDAVVKNGLGVFVGKGEIAKWLEQDVKTTGAAPQTWEMKGPMVVNTGMVALDRFRKAGIPYVAYRSEYMVGPDGKIHFFAPVTLPTPEQVAKLGAPPAANPAVDPIKIAQEYVKAANTGNFDGAFAFYAPNAAALVVNGTRLLSSKDQIGAWLKEDVKTTRANPAGWQVIGNTVVNTGTVSLERFKKLGIDSVQYRSEYVIQDGKIRFFRPSVLLTPEQQAKVAASPSR